MKAENIHTLSKQKERTDENSDIKKLFIDVLKVWPVIVAFVIINLGIAYVTIKRTNPTYQVKATLEIKQDKNAESIDLFQNIGIKVPNSIDNEIAILNSFTLAFNAVKGLDFNVEYFKKDFWKHYEVYHTLPYVVEVDWNHRQLLGGELEVQFIDKDRFSLNIANESLWLYDPKTKDKKIALDLKKLNVVGNYRLNEWIEGKNYRFKVIQIEPKTNGSLEFSFRLRSDFDLAEFYSKKMKVELLKKESSILSIGLESQMVEKDKAYINKLIEVYQNRELKVKNQTSINTAAFIKEQLKSITDSMVFFEDKLQKYRTKNESFNLKEQGNVVYSRLSTLQDNSAAIGLKIKYYQSTLAYLEQDKVSQLVVPSSIGIEETILEKLIPELLEDQNKRERLRQVLSPQNQALKDLEFKYVTLLATVRENLKRSLNVAKLSLQDVNKRIAELGGELDMLPQVERNLLSIQRQFTISENIYTYLLQKRSEAEITSASNVPSSQILDLSRQVGGMLSPISSRNYIIAFCLGILIPVLIIFVRNSFDNKIYDVKLLEKRVLAPLVGIVFRNFGKEGSNVVLNSPRAFISENFRSIRASTQFLHEREDSLVISFTSGKAGEGKTFCSINTAAIYSLSGKKTILVGMDLRMPRIAEHFDLPNDVGVSNYLIGNGVLKDMIKPSGSQNLDVLLSGPLPPNPAELIVRPTFLEMIKELRAIYDVIILDCPPAGFVSETIDIFKVADINFYIFRHLNSEWNSIDYLNSLIEKGLIKKAYVIYNDMEVVFNKQYGYGYHAAIEKQTMSKKMSNWLTRK
ncbi:polysaccharide biosynthesis tyrosine autokinase [Pedobacter sp. ASV28]|uniref:GumC family protein n=1 Tax=Pedobacter sp. ASV28 TaxID=2795123 RepID=UPI0018EDEA8B|nr:polysaccharide biosynthesis tyrosine autokinase [Pedobacter sp. ASV28]